MPHRQRPSRHSEIVPLPSVDDPHTDQPHKFGLGRRQVPVTELLLNDSINRQGLIPHLVGLSQLSVSVAEAIATRVRIDPPCLPYNLRQASVVHYLKTMDRLFTHLVQSRIWSAYPPLLRASSGRPANTIASCRDERVGIHPNRNVSSL